MASLTDTAKALVNPWPCTGAMERNTATLLSKDVITKAETTLAALEQALGLLRPHGLVTLVLYSGLIWGVLPLRAWVSWEGHLFGMLAGVLIAYLEAKSSKGGA